MLAAIRALNAAKVSTKGDLVFVATVQEEVGLKGMDYWLNHNPKPDLLIGLDGGLGPIAYGALGIYWTKYVFTSPGSHTVLSRGKPTPVKALSAAIDNIYKLQYGPLPEGAVINVGQVHGGVVQGIGQARMENCGDDRETGQLLTGSQTVTVRLSYDARQIGVSGAGVSVLE